MEPTQIGIVIVIREVSPKITLDPPTTNETYLSFSCGVRPFGTGIDFLVKVS